jgi:transcription initiation factor TFIIIB Brf1 subunit/transcription initiation factor TFIIB
MDVENRERFAKAVKAIRADRNHEEIAKIMAVNIRSLCKAVTHFSPTDNTVLQTQIGIAERICATLSLNDEQRQKVMDALYDISLRSEDDFEHTPKTIVAGVLSVILGGQIPRIAEVSGVSTVSIRKITEKLKAMGSM